MVLAPNHVGDFHLDVVHDVDEMENPGAIGPANRHVGIRLRIGQIELDAAANRIVDDDLLALESKTEGAMIVVNSDGGAQLLEIRTTDFFALALVIRPEISAVVRVFIPIQVETA